MINVLEELNNLKSEKHKNFSENITKNCHPMIGVPIPKLRELAKQITKLDFLEFLNSNPMKYYEEVVLQGLVIGYAKFEPELKFKYLKNFISQIKDWSQCDTVVSSLKFFNKNLKQTYQFLEPYFNSEKEFEKRFAIISYMDYFFNDEFFEIVLERLTNVNSVHYYVNMAVAWAISVAFVKNFDLTLKYFKNSNINNFTFNKTIQKCVESFRITPEQKQILKTLKNKTII